MDKPNGQQDDDTKTQSNGQRDGMNGLTTKQREAIELAFKRGWYDDARQVSSPELADELEISVPAYLERLRNAERKVVKEYLEEQ